MSQQPTITIINANTLSIIVDDDAEPQIISRHSAGVCNINFGSSEVQRFFWDYLRSLATGASIVADEEGTLDAVIQSILDRLDSLEGGQRLAAQLHQEQQGFNHSQAKVNEQLATQMKKATKILAARGLHS
tara:strand:- start:336 stop:728 length:393 start_codon:yes stop_codon:yes gene_type:complete